LNYDQILLPCWGSPITKTPAELANLVTYGNSGGHFFATHYSYTWLFKNSPFDQTARWNPQHNTNIIPPPNGVSFTGNVDVNNNPKGGVFVQWLNLVGALSATSPPQVTIQGARHDVDSVNPGAIDWIDGTDPGDQSQMLLHYTFDTPWAQKSQCGHAIYSDFHVNLQSGTYGQTFPAECGAAAPLTSQERILEYMIWDLQSCLLPPPPPSCNPVTCRDQNLSCGPAGDGCGNQIDCGPCPEGGTCLPKTCMDQHITCGPAGDGCGSPLNCGPCTPPKTCGGGGVHGQCGGGCTPGNCAQQNIACGPAGDGCGGLLDCGPCTLPQTCGGGGVSGHCGGGGTCTPKTCQQQNTGCGPAGDGCGGLLNCGQCVAPQTCGGAGVPGQCGGGTI
jgi:hypothetical protein